MRLPFLREEEAERLRDVDPERFRDAEAERFREPDADLPRDPFLEEPFLLGILISISFEKLKKEVFFFLLFFCFLSI